MVAIRAHHKGQEEVCDEAQHGEGRPEDFLLHVHILDPGQLFFPWPNVYKGAMQRSLLSVAQSVQAQVLGDGGVEVSGIASITQATSADLVFVEDEKGLPAALASRAAAVIAGEFARADGSKQGPPASKPLLIVKNPRLAFARAARLLCPAPDRPPGTHASAVVHASARLGKNVSLAERVVLGENVEIGDGSWIGAGAVIGAGVSLGERL